MYFPILFDFIQNASIGASSPPNHPLLECRPSFPPETQNQLVVLTKCLNDGIRTYLQLVSANPADVCTWRGVQCTDGLVTHLHIAHQVSMYSMRAAWTLQMDWLPSTARFVHLGSIKFPIGWHPDRLPRDLRYLYMYFCFNSSLDAQQGTKYDIDLRRLPSRMEELIVVSSIIGRVIDLRRLPDTMRFVFIKHHPRHIDSVYIDYHLLPETLEHVHVVDFSGKGSMKRRIRQSGQPRRIRLETNLDRNMPFRGSRYMEQFAHRL